MFRPKFFLISLLLISAFCFPTLLVAASFFDQFIDPIDGKFDSSQWLAGRSGFLPIPLFISDPAVGYGGGLAVVFLHESKDEEVPMDDPNQLSHLPPSVSFGAAAYTENDSWLTAGGHIASWKKDTIRYTGVAGYGDLNLKFFGINSDTNPLDIDFNFNIKGFFLLQELVFRIKQSNFFVGGRYRFLKSDIGFQFTGLIPDAPAVQFDTSTAGLGIIIKYDTRDNIISPNSGHYARIEPEFYDTAFGGDFDYVKTKVSSISYWPVSALTLGLRLEGQFSGGDVPFYDAPYIEMRGIPALRYQGQDVALAEVEARWDFNPRWSLVGFFGSGWTGDSISDLSGEQDIYAGGGGIRYLLARRYGLRVGLDVARGPEDTVFYLAVGSSWN